MTLKDVEEGEMGGKRKRGSVRKGGTDSGVCVCKCMRECKCVCVCVHDGLMVGKH